MTPALAQALAAGATVITPNRRLALFIKHQYDTAQTTSGKSVWPSADALPYGAFLERTWQELSVAENGALLLSVQQEIALWETVIEGSRYAGLLLNPAAAARAARDAWVTQHAFGMDSPRHRAAWESVNDDTAAYSEWRRAYGERLRTAGWIDSAQLPDVIIGVLIGGARIRTQHLLRAGYDVYTPQQQALFEALATTGCVIADAPKEAAAAGACTVVSHACDDAEAELHFVAQRVRTLLVDHADTQPRLRVGVVVPDLAARRTAVMRVFDDVLEPQRALAPNATAPRLFNCSLGLPLSSYPIVFTAFFILKLAGGEATLEEAGALLRSPYIGGAEAELAARALVDAQLRERSRQRVTPGALWQAAQGDGSPSALRLAALLEPWIAQARDARRLRQPPSAWSATFLALLKGLAWPGERTLDSMEFQTFEKFREAISGLSALDPLRARLTQPEALSVLRRLAADTVFQPEANDAPVQILGTLESLGLSFDALFAVGLAGETWPAAPRPNPFLPVALQRALEVPHASAAWELQFARRMTLAWRDAAPTVTFTWPQRDGERELTMSPLLDAVPAATSPSVAPALLRDALYAARSFETLDDWRGPALPVDVSVRGGAQVFQNQAACAFRAYAIHRLGASTLDEGVDGLDARDRGTLVHHALTLLWRDLGSQAHLLALDDAAIEQKIHGAVNGAVDALCAKRPDIMTDAFAAIERTRLHALLLRLTALEKNRAPFEVVGREQQRPIEIAGMRLSARLDRVDQLQDGSQLILDYKTGLANIGGWLGERPDEPQLPLYAVSDAADVAGVAFVQLRAREVAFKGVTRDGEVLPDVAALAASKTLVAQYATWPALLDAWRTVLEQLARDYLAGHAEVAPKYYPKTCEYCGLNSLCRVQELTARSAAADGDDA
jgi:probable DNA repair protein